MGLDDLEVHRLAKEFSNEIWEIVLLFNYFEKDTVGKQLCRSADSISSNIAEGYGRYFYKENKQFCYYARGSIFETKDWITKLKDRKIISEERFSGLDNKLNTLGKMLNSYIKAIGKNNIEQK
ncbi:MAG TPA: four helix bundle protein [Chitinophagales bacterium]|nr:four helix bundle protein [Chitinophagales bacterium]HQD11747.1 four helix bundle protein [Chitinophagales bacterium]HQO32130.1 four helix bundle protein [Chitinophagales bacterium]HQO89729.1 four helix bundle protein [Chitinophagales bacterium]